MEQQRGTEEFFPMNLLGYPGKEGGEETTILMYNCSSPPFIACPLHLDAENRISPPHCWLFALQH